MPKLVHTHHILKGGEDSPHVDSFGNEFGGDEHVAATKDKAVRFSSETGLAVVEHSHANVSSEPHPQTKIDQWTYKSEEEKAAEDEQEIEA